MPTASAAATRPCALGAGVRSCGRLQMRSRGASGAIGTCGTCGTTTTMETTAGLA